jgi:hypothetical protein
MLAVYCYRLSGFADSDGADGGRGYWQYPPLNVRQPVSVQQASNSLALKDAYDYGAIHGRSGLLLLPGGWTKPYVRGGVAELEFGSLRPQARQAPS